MTILDNIVSHCGAIVITFVHITGRIAAQRGFHPTRNPSNGRCKIPPAEPFTPAVPVSTRVSAGINTLWPAIHPRACVCRAVCLRPGLVLGRDWPETAPPTVPALLTPPGTRHQCTPPTHPARYRIRVNTLESVASGVKDLVCIEYAILTHANDTTSAQPFLARNLLYMHMFVSTTNSERRNPRSKSGLSCCAVLSLAWSIKPSQLHKIKRIQGTRAKNAAPACFSLSLAQYSRSWQWTENPGDMA